MHCHCDTNNRAPRLNYIWQKHLYQQNIKKNIDNTNTNIKLINHRAIADRLRTINWSNYSNSNCVVSLLGAQPSNSLQHLKSVNKPPYRKRWPPANRSRKVIAISTKTSKVMQVVCQTYLSFLDLKIKVIGSDIHTSVYDKRDDFGFSIVNFPWLTGDVPRLSSYGIYISQLVRFARCCTSVFEEKEEIWLSPMTKATTPTEMYFQSKNLQITSKLPTQGYRYHKFRKTFGKFFRSYSELLSKFGDISFQEYVTKGISHPVFYGDLVYKLRRVKDTPNFISSGSKTVKCLRRRRYDPLTIERTICLVLGPSTALYGPFIKHCTLTNKAVGTIWRALSKPPQRRQGPYLCPLWLLVGTPSAIRPELAFSRAEHSLPYSDVTIYIFAFLYLLFMLNVYRFLWPLRWGWLLFRCLYKEVYLQIFKLVSFWLHGCCGEWEGWTATAV